MGNINFWYNKRISESYVAYASDERLIQPICLDLYENSWIALGYLLGRKDEK